jgi:DNA-binding response OmpR family regulator
VLVAHNGAELTGIIERLLSGSGYQAIPVSDGVQAMVELERQRPAVAVLDVALPSIYGFEICDRIKHRPESSEMKVILIASIYDKTRYKREPTSLYGADDYIEKHHIEDFLVKKVDRLLSPAPQPQVREEKRFAPPPPSEMPRREAQAEKMRQEEMRPIAAPSAVDPQQVEAARRFARIIISDIALYNQGAVEDGIRGGNLTEALSEEFKEGRELYNSRVPAEVRGQMDYFADELEKFVEKKKAILDMGG